MLTPPKKNQSFEPVPAGNHVARLFEIIHIGTIPTEWQGQEKMTDKIRLSFELCNERKEFKEGEGEKPFSISREFTYSFGAKGNLRPFIDGMTGTKMNDGEFPDLEALLGEACLLNVVHVENDGKTYANIQGASPLPKGMEAPELFNEIRMVDINSTSWDVINALPDFILKKMYSSEEFSNRKRAEEALGEVKVKNFRPKAVGEPVIEYPTEDINPDDVPF